MVKILLTTLSVSLLAQFLLAQDHQRAIDKIPTREQIRADKDKARSRITEENGFWRKIQRRGAFVRRGRTSQQEKIIKSLMITKKLKSKYQSELLNRDYFLFRMVGRKKCKEKDKPSSKCNSYNRGIELFGRNISLLKREYNSENSTDFHLKSEEVKDSQVFSFSASKSDTFFYIANLGIRPLVTVKYQDPFVQKVKNFTLGSNELKSPEMDPDSMILSMPEGPRKVLGNEKVLIGRTYLIRVILPSDQTNPFLNPEIDHIYAIKVLGEHKKGVFTMVGKTIWTFERPSEDSAVTN